MLLSFFAVTQKNEVKNFDTPNISEGSNGSYKR